jgi:signal transduction histidine kinase
LRFRSILIQIVFLHAFALIFAAIFLPLFLGNLLDADVDRLQQRSMRDQAERIGRRLAIAPDGTWSLKLPARLLDQYSQAYGRYAFVVLNSVGDVLFSSRTDRRPLQPIGDVNAPISFFETLTPGGAKTISGTSLRYEREGKVVWVQVSEDLSHRDVIVDDVVAHFFRQIRLITIPAMLILLVIDIVIFRRAMRPLLEASQQASSIGPTRIDVRLTADNVPAEIRPLVTAFNQALDRLEQGFRAQREFAADAAHELRTPLAILLTRIETLQDKQASRELKRDLTGMKRVVNQLLDAADLDTVVIDAAELADLREICIEIAAFIAPLAFGQGKSVAVTGTDDPVIVRGNSEMLRRAVRNLVENALNHAPEDTAVEIDVAPDGTVSVRDEGPGVAPEEREMIFARFWRRDRRAGSAGLGLSIVKRIVEVHGGVITVRNRPARGAEFVVRIAPLRTEVVSQQAPQASV